MNSILPQRNPEFIRNVWLELSPTRLIVAPVSLFLVFGIVHLGMSAKPLVFTGERVASAMNNTALFLFMLLSVLWGSRQVFNSLFDEVRSHTWDIQRMSSLGAWPLVWGKLLGAAVYSWYVVTFVLAIFFLYGITLFGVIAAIKLTVLLLLVGILAHTVCMVIALSSMHRIRQRATGKVGTIVMFLFGLFMASSVSGLAVFRNQAAREHIVVWWGIELSALHFFIGSLSFFLAWALLGAYRLMRRELRYHSIPWAWPAFLIYLSIYFSGFASDVLREIPFFEGAFSQSVFLFVSVTGTYLMLLAHPTDIVEYRKLVSAFRTGRVVRVLTLLPAWSTSFLVLVVACMNCLLFAPPEASILRAFSVSLALFFLRDLGIFIYTHFGSSAPHRADAAASFYLALLYFVLPLFAGALGLPSVARFFYPNVQAGFISIGGVLVQLAIVGLLIRHRWETRLVA